MMPPCFTGTTILDTTIYVRHRQFTGTTYYDVDMCCTKHMTVMYTSNLLAQQFLFM